MIALLGLMLRGPFSANFLPLAASARRSSVGGVLQAFSGSELIEVSTGLTIAVFALLDMRHDWADADAVTEARDPRQLPGRRWRCSASACTRC